MKLAIGTDHRGPKVKKEIIEHFKDEYEFIDCSPNNYDTDDYPDYAFKVSKKVVDGEAKYGILLCGTGIGMSIAANKVKGIRCALIHTTEEAKLAKVHNDANVIAINADMPIDEIYNLIDTFVKTDPTREERHQRRINKIISYEEGTYNEL